MSMPPNRHKYDSDPASLNIYERFEEIQRREDDRKRQQRGRYRELGAFEWPEDEGEE